jgi:Periplasmic binding protein
MRAENLGEENRMIPSRKTLTSVVVVCAVTLIAAGCGSSKNSTSATTTSPAATPLAGVTASQIKIGMWWVDSQGTCAKTHVTSGSAACGAGDESEFKNMTAYINAHGGVGGRQVVPVIFHTGLSGITFAQGLQQACTYFTQDNPVGIVITQDSIPGNSVSCFVQHHVITVQADTYPYDNADYAAYFPYVYGPDHPRPERWVKAYVAGLASAHFFTGGVKVGLVRYNYPEYNSVFSSVMMPELQKNGVTLAQDAVITAPSSIDALGSLQTQLTTAILKFKSAGVNRVLFLTDVGTTDLFWYSIAKSQNYFPEYGLSSTQQMSVFVDMAPKGTLNNAVGVGWNPFYDVKAAQDPGGSTAADTCKMVLNNPTDTPAGRNAKCDSLTFIQTVLDKAAASHNLTVQGFQKAAASLGTSFQPAEVLSDQFGPGLYDGPSSYRVYSFSTACKCFQYTGPSTPMPEDPVPNLH